MEDTLETTHIPVLYSVFESNYQQWCSMQTKLKTPNNIIHIVCEFSQLMDTLLYNFSNSIEFESAYPFHN